MIETDLEKFEDFIEVYDNVVSPEFCEHAIAHYNALDESRVAYSRQAFEATSAIDKDNTIAFLADTPGIQRVSGSPNNVLEEFHNAAQECFQQYASKFKVLAADKLSMNQNVQLQKTPRTGGYHVWHCEQGYNYSTRAIFIQLYLNTVEEGGETEFLYQSKRVQAVQGRMLMCPAGYPHTHRGNPPMKGEKFTINSWIEYI
jgi:hypothetical protein|tara:strand:- start:272 stop:874 length:603 start_codon:yes stop_codon:yes gene_type:complete